nr:hypothetical protein [Tanacetum cinerariifolium]
MPPPINRRDDILKTKMPPHKRLCLSTLGSRYEVGESFTARPTEGRGIDYGFVSTLDAEARRRGFGEVGYGIRDTWIDPTETGTEPIIPPPSTDTTTIGARIIVRLQAGISLPLKVEVERLLAMPTPSPSPLTSLSPPSAGERLALGQTRGNDQEEKQE